MFINNNKIYPTFYCQTFGLPNPFLIGCSVGNDLNLEGRGGGGWGAGAGGAGRAPMAREIARDRGGD